MKKQLVEADNVAAFICQESGKLYADGSLLLTAGAKDELARRGIAIVYGAKPQTGASCPPGCLCPGCAPKGCPPGCTCQGCAATECAGQTPQAERLMLAVAVMLKEQYGIHDLATLKEMSMRVMLAIRNTL